MKKYLYSILMFLIIFQTEFLFAFSLRNTYESELKCLQVNKPHRVYIVPANTKNDFSNVPSVVLKQAGKYKCKTADKIFSSTCEVSEFQPQATFNINDGSVSCSTPLKAKK